jgi:hypothetical protein
MAKTKLLQFNKQLLLVASPALQAVGFKPSKHRYFYRSLEHEKTTSIQIIQFQIGIKHLIGKFTVNLGVFNPELAEFAFYKPTLNVYNPDICHCMFELHQRLGFLYTPPKSLIQTIFHSRSKNPQDHWWDQHETEGEMVKTMNTVIDLVMEKGLPWLDSHTSKKAFDWAIHERQKRATASKTQSAA